MTFKRKKGVRTVYEAEYIRNEHRSIFFVGNIDDIEEFIIFSIKYCLNPKYYDAVLVMPDTKLIYNYENRYKCKINMPKINEFLAFFNHHNPAITIDNAKNGTVTARNIKYLSASRYLRYLERMAILKEEYKANRINKLLDDFTNYLENGNIDYDIYTLRFFLNYVKNSYLPNRSVYVKK